MVARLGGDEFALLLPETNQEAALVVIGKLQDELLTAMQQNSWPITFSGGALSCFAAPATTSELVKVADTLMYSAKRTGLSSTPVTPGKIIVRKMI